MKAFVITLRGNEYSERVATRCIESANIPVERFTAITADKSLSLLREIGLRWTWGDGYKGMKHKPYGGNLGARIGCFLSHFLLWQICVKSGPIMILEHDAVFIRDFEPFDFAGACMLNDPLGATPRGDWWSERMELRGPGVWPKTKVFDDTRPDGLAGNSAYVLQPHAAQRLIELVYEIGAWPNDATICRQLVPWLEEVYPFVTEVQAGQSTI